MAVDAVEATESLPKEAGLVGLDRPLDQLDLTKMLAESLEPEEQERSEETSPSGDAVEEAEPVEESTEEFFRKARLVDGYGSPFWMLDASELNKGPIKVEAF